MRTAIGALVGAVGGVALGTLAVGGVSHGVLRVPQQAVFLVATPAAHVVSWVSGWPLEQEAALLCYGVGFVITVPLVSGAIGAVVGALGTRASSVR